MMMMSAPSSSFHDYLAVGSSAVGELKAVTVTSVQQKNENFMGTFNEKNIGDSNTNKINQNSCVKRPMNAFLLWARGERKRVSSDGYGVSQTSLSKLLGETWRHMSIEEKQPFLDMAETLKRQHHIDHPDYKFKPKQRATSMKKNQNITTLQRENSTVNSSSTSSSSSSSLQCTFPNSQSSIPNVTPHPVQSNVLAMCQAIVPTTALSPDIKNDWFLHVTEQPQSVIIAPNPQNETSPIQSRRAVRIQIINKHDDIALPPPALLPMTPPPLRSSPSSSSSNSVIADESTPTLIDYFVNNSNIFHRSSYHHQQVLASVIDDSNEFDTVNDSSSINHLTDLDQHYDSNGWIDTPLSNFGTNSMDMVSSSPYSSYDFLCL